MADFQDELDLAEELAGIFEGADPDVLDQANLDDLADQIAAWHADPDNE